MPGVGRPRQVRGREVSEKLARIRASILDPNRPEDAGDIKVDGASMRAKIRPFMETTDEDGLSGSVTVKLPYDLYRKIDRILSDGRCGNLPVPYRNQSEFTRDAYYKWFEFLSERFDPDNVEDSVFLMARQDLLKMQEEYGQNHELEKALAAFFRLLPSYLDSRRPDVLYKELERWHRILVMYEDYDKFWSDRWKAQFISNPYVRASLDIVLSVGEYKQSTVATDMQRWIGEIGL